VPRSSHPGRHDNPANGYRGGVRGLRRKPPQHGTRWASGPAHPQVVAHRGASSHLAEHTLAAYIAALEDGAEALECDVRLTADGHLVCVHDRRVERTSNGAGPVSTLELSTLKELDWASWKNPWADLDDEAEEPDGVSGGILTLEQLCAMVRDWGRRVDLAVETKHPTRYAGLVERRLEELLSRFGWTRPQRDPPPVRVMSFSRLSLRRMRELAPELPQVFLMSRVPLIYRDGSLPMEVRVAGLEIAALRADPDYVRRCAEQANSVHAWVVNDPGDVALCRDLGVDAVITDRPREARAQLRAGESGIGFPE
jgi:glycerophosphoryl diester phosphodiesterase